MAGVSQVERERFCNPLPAVGLAGFPRGLLEEITDDDAITVMRCLTGGGKPYRATAIQKMLRAG